ncbi:hypothetical protein BKA61DRAFT_671951 [Leptodontidium sp. MPI-SDFR-AT-0119]|nr:hypothetical protein BKA61DRAFT_671951 [Leptodontidium sp. MPI-SDFR-AT-0119]
MREDDRWLDAEDYTPKYSAVIKLAQLIVVQEAYERRREAITRYEERSLSPELYCSRSYGFKIRYITIAEGKIQ